VIGASVFFANAPRDRLLRDAFGIDLSTASHGEWRVYVGLWHASGDHQRIPAHVPGELGPHEDRVAVGSFEVR
jgi:hypothetical protein